MCKPRRRKGAPPPATLSYAVERAIEHAECNPRLGTLHQLHTALVAIDPVEFAARPQPATAVHSTDRAARVEVLAARLRCGQELWRADEIIHLPPRSRAASMTI